MSQTTMTLDDSWPDYPMSGDVMHKTDAASVRARVLVPGSAAHEGLLCERKVKDWPNRWSGNKKVFSFHAGPAWPNHPSFGEYVAIMRELAEAGNVTMDELTADGRDVL